MNHQTWSQRIEPPAEEVKKEVPRSLSASSIMRPAMREGNAHRNWSIVQKVNIVNMGSLTKLTPRALCQRIVTSMFTVPTVFEAARTMRAAAPNVSPEPGLNWSDVSGDLFVHTDAGDPPGTKKLAKAVIQLITYIN